MGTDMPNNMKFVPLPSGRVLIIDCRALNVGRVFILCQALCIEMNIIVEGKKHQRNIFNSILEYLLDLSCAFSMPFQCLLV